MEHQVEERLLTPKQVADRWQVHPELLANWRHAGVGPPYVKIGHSVRYSSSAIDAYEAAHERGGS